MLNQKQLISVLLIFTSTLFHDSFEKVLTIEEFADRPIPKYAEQLSGEALVDYVNRQQPFFEAEYLPEVAEKRLGSLMKMDFLLLPAGMDNVTMVGEPVTNEELPESFDSREKWKDCPSISYIRDQSNCGSCWAVAAASTMSDRLCIQSKGKIKTLISDTDILSCCQPLCGDGCNGGSLMRAWYYARDHGVCSGGRYEEKGVCKPYAFHPCGRHKGQKYHGECPRHIYKTPLCKPYCQYGYGKRYKDDKIYAKAVYGIFSFEDAIRMIIMKKGPVSAAFTVYEDFAYYRRGVYVHTAGKKTGRHAVKIIGWGVQNGTKYWTVANSWNTDWGEDGYFRILRGKKHCGIESSIYTGDF
ncbi:hypothetical protein V3C99_005960 [Haemonchus contortus]|uniref:Pept_C1 domain-containing protein n=1 Tax=Haemonchus contortus TaxID=6289 RepID=A0A7I5EF54_HAECO